MTGGCSCENGWIIVTVPECQLESEEGVKVYSDSDPEEMREVARPCPICRGKSYMANRTKRKARIPSAFYDAEFKDFDWTIYEDNKGNKIDLEQRQVFVTSFLADYREWEKSGIGLYIWSKMKGSGKTFLALAICNTLIKERHINPKFVSAADLLDIASDKSQSNDPIRDLCDCDLLVIDDLGQKKTGEDWMEDILFRIFDTRMMNKKVTIVTSNKKMEEQQFDDRISDRMFKILQPIPLPEYCVRAKEAKEAKKTLLKKLGLMGGQKAGG